MKHSRSSVRALIFVVGLAVSSVAAQDGVMGQGGRHLALRAGTIDTSAGVSAAAISQQVGARAVGKRWVIQLDGPITPARRAAIQAAGIELGDYLPENAYLAKLDRAQPRAVGQLGFVRWFGEYQNTWKLDPEIGVRRYVTPDRVALAAKGRDRLTVVAFADADIQSVEKAVWSIRGAEIHESNMVGGRWEVIVAMRVADAPRLAAHPGVQFIEPSSEAVLRSNYNTRWIVQSNAVGVFPVYANGIHGEGQIVGIIDEQVNPQHCSFIDAVNPIGPLHRKLVAYSGAQGYGFHGTHVGGTAAGDAGTDTADTRGIAYAGKIAYGGSFNGALTEAGFYAAAGFDHAAGARVHTNSWGNDGTTSYDGLCRGIDRFAYDNEDDLVLFAVSNGSVVTNPENAKNCLGTGAAGPVGSQETLCSGGTGPTGQGLRRPEIWAPGCSTLSSTGSGASCATASASGTSMSSPALAGVAMLVRQYFTGGYYPTGVSGANPALTPSGALMRAMLLNSGQDMSGGTGYPGLRENWGRVRIDDPLFFPGDARKLLVKDVRNSVGLSTGGSNDTNIQVLGSGQPLRITLVFTEPAAAAGAGAPTINNLDLEVIDPSANTYKGNVFNTAAGVSVTGGSADALNTAEQVLVTNPTTGTWTVRVKGTAVNSGTQGFAVVATGDIVSGTPPALSISLPSGAPTLIPPGVTTNIDVRVIPGSQTVVVGSPTMFYRLTGVGSYASQQLLSLGGNDYRGTLPAAACGQVPQFYFTASGSGGAVVNSPSNAPTSVYSTAVGALSSTTVLQTDFGAVLPVGWSATGLWHMSSSCPPSGTACAGPQWALYGQDATCTFNNGATNTGILSSPAIALPAVPVGGNIALSFCSALVTENLSGYDKAEVLVNGNSVSLLSDSEPWTTINVDLTSFAGQSVTLGFRFDTVDNINNDVRGWHVDNVKITATGTSCTNPPSCYADCDHVGGLTGNDFQCFLDAYVSGQSYADCDGVGGLTGNDFQCFLDKFVAGCS